MKAIPSLLLIIFSVTARADLIDLTPGGFTEGVNTPPFFFQLVRKQQIAHAYFSDGQTFWFTSTPFGADHFTAIDLSTEANVAWSSLPDNYHCHYVLVEGTNLQENIYKVQFPKQTEDPGEFVTLNGIATVNTVIFFGSNVPDTGSTILLMILSVSFLFIANNRIGRTEKHKQ